MMRSDSGPASPRSVECAVTVSQERRSYRRSHYPQSQTDRGNILREYGRVLWQSQSLLPIQPNRQYRPVAFSECQTVPTKLLSDLGVLGRRMTHIGIKANVAMAGNTETAMAVLRLRGLGKAALRVSLKLAPSSPKRPWLRIPDTSRKSLQPRRGRWGLQVLPHAPEPVHPINP